jgi:hypothetical protein
LFENYSVRRVVEEEEGKNKATTWSLPPYPSSTLHPLKPPRRRERERESYHSLEGGSKKQKAVGAIGIGLPDWSIEGDNYGRRESHD